MKLDENERFFERPFDSRINIDGFNSLLQNNKWSYKPFKVSQSKNNYNEYVYFYEYAQDIIYNLDSFEDAKKRNASSFFYEFESQHGSFELKIAKNENNPEKTFTLQLDGISLRVYATGIAVLAYNLQNTEYESLEDVLQINDFMRRIYPQYLGEDFSTESTKCSFLPLSVTLKLDNGTELFEDFSYFDSFCCNSNPNRLPSFIKNLLGGDETTSNEQKFIENESAKLFIRHIINDRMYLICWYGNDEIASRRQTFDITNKDEVLKKQQSYLDDDDWYKYLFVDGNSMMCQSVKMTRELLEKHTYDRWAGYGTLFGISRYSFMCLTSSFETLKNNKADFIVTHIRTMYFQMVSLLLAQRASVLRFSDEVNEISSLKDDRLGDSTSKLYHSYIHFINKLFFREVTAQDQGIELYNKAMEIMQIEKHVKDLDAEIAELHQYVQLTEDTKANKNMEKLTKVGTALLPAALVASIFGMNKIGDFDISFFLELLLLFTGIGLGIFFTKKRR